jgi:2,4-dienoyl-CoA reductase-like NADH-dependent reductase (Old Yellow Enzyme family)/thioredoxin reductase
MRLAMAFNLAVFFKDLHGGAVCSRDFLSRQMAPIAAESRSYKPVKTVRIVKSVALVHDIDFYTVPHQNRIAMTAFNSLFQPIQIGSMTVDNRLLMSAMSINFGVNANGHVTEQLIEYLVTRAKGGVGMLLVGGGGVHPSGLELPDLPALWDDDCIPSLGNLARSVKATGCRCGMQLMHGGRQSYHDRKVAPSAIAAPAVVKGIPRALEVEEIRMLAASFGDAARRCRDAGFDFIEVHGAHGYLINQFLSPNANRRTDAYGGPFNHRIRFFLEILADIKAKCGADFPVGLRINGEDYIKDGWGLDDAKRLAVILEGCGADYLHVSAGVYGSSELTIPSMYTQQGCFIHLAEAVKQVVKIPVVAVGRIKSPQLACEVIESGKADMVALGRSLLADPQWPLKARSGKVDRIRPCIGCCLGCIHAVLQLEPGGCVVNPDVGREFLLEDTAEAVSPRTVLVVGAGPAGLAAARMATLQGHQVTVCEQSDHVGGALHYAAMAPGRGEVGDIIGYFEAALKSLGVDLRLDTALDASLIDSVSPDTVILATGSLVDIPMLKGLIQTRLGVCTATELYAEKIDIGPRVVVWGGNQAGLVTADYLAERGKHVVVLSRKAHFAEEMSSNDRFYLRERLKAGGVELYKKVVVERFTQDGVVFHIGDRVVTLAEFDSVVLAEPFVAVRQAANLLKGVGADVVFVGDAKRPRHVMYAISEGEEAARAL